MADKPVTPTEPMPWGAALRLRCLEAAAQAAMRKGLRDVLEEADRYVAWAVLPLPAPEIASDREGKRPTA